MDNVLGALTLTFWWGAIWGSVIAFSPSFGRSEVKAKVGDPLAVTIALLAILAPIPIGWLAIAKEEGLMIACAAVVLEVGYGVYLMTKYLFEINLAQLGLVDYVGRLPNEVQFLLTIPLALTAAAPVTFVYGLFIRMPFGKLKLDDEVPLLKLLGICLIYPIVGSAVWWLLCFVMYIFTSIFF